MTYLWRHWKSLWRHITPFSDRFRSNVQERSVVVRDRLQAINGVYMTSSRVWRQIASFFASYGKIWIKIAGKGCRGPDRVIRYTCYKWRIYDVMERVYDVILRHFSPFIDQFGSNLQERSVVSDYKLYMTYLWRHRKSLWSHITSFMDRFRSAVVRVRL